MSANFSAAYPHSWLQPVQYDWDEYRLFVAALDAGLADLMEAHASPDPLVSCRSVRRGLECDTPSDSQPPTPPGHSSSY